MFFIEKKDVFIKNVTKRSLSDNKNFFFLIKISSFASRNAFAILKPKISAYFTVK